MIALEHKRDGVVEVLLAHGADLDYRRSIRVGLRDDSSALNVAALKHRWDPVQWLVEAGADLSAASFRTGKACNVSPLMLAASWDLTALVELMLTKGADPNHVATMYDDCEDNSTALHYACVCGCRDHLTVQLLCDAGANVNALSVDGVPLHLAVGWQAPRATVSTLVVAGADPFELDKLGLTVTEAMGHDDVLLDSRPFKFKL